MPVSIEEVKTVEGSCTHIKISVTNIEQLDNKNKNCNDNISKKSDNQQNGKELNVQGAQAVLPAKEVIEKLLQVGGNYIQVCSGSNENTQQKNVGEKDKISKKSTIIVEKESVIVDELTITLHQKTSDSDLLILGQALTGLQPSKLTLNLSDYKTCNNQGNSFWVCRTLKIFQRIGYEKQGLRKLEQLQVNLDNFDSGECNQLTSVSSIFSDGITVKELSFFCKNASSKNMQELFIDIKKSTKNNIFTSLSIQCNSIGSEFSEEKYKKTKENKKTKFINFLLSFGSSVSTPTIKINSSSKQSQLCDLPRFFGEMLVALCSKKPVGGSQIKTPPISLKFAFPSTFQVKDLSKSMLLDNTTALELDNTLEIGKFDIEQCSFFPGNLCKYIVNGKLKIAEIVYPEFSQEFEKKNKKWLVVKFAVDNSNMQKQQSKYASINEIVKKTDKVIVLDTSKYTNSRMPSIFGMDLASCFSNHDHWNALIILDQGSFSSFNQVIYKGRGISGNGSGECCVSSNKILWQILRKLFLHLKESEKKISHGYIVTIMNELQKIDTGMKQYVHVTTSFGGGDRNVTVYKKKENIYTKIREFYIIKNMLTINNLRYENTGDEKKDKGEKNEGEKNTMSSSINSSIKIFLRQEGPSQQEQKQKQKQKNNRLVIVGKGKCVEQALDEVPTACVYNTNGDELLGDFTLMFPKETFSTLLRKIEQNIDVDGFMRARDITSEELTVILPGASPEELLLKKEVHSEKPLNYMWSRMRTLSLFAARDNDTFCKLSQNKFWQKMEDIRISCNK